MATGRFKSGILGRARLFAGLALCWLLLMLGAGAALALEGIPVPPETDTINLTNLAVRVDQANDRIQVSNAPGPDGRVPRTAGPAQEAGPASSLSLITI